VTGYQKAKAIHYSARYFYRYVDNTARLQLDGRYMEHPESMSWSPSLSNKFPTATARGPERLKFIFSKAAVIPRYTQLQVALQRLSWTIKYQRQTEGQLAEYRTSKARPL